MELHDLVRHEWWEDHRLSRRSLIWIDDHAEPDDPHPILTAVAQLRSEGPNWATEQPTSPSPSPHLL